MLGGFLPHGAEELEALREGCWDQSLSNCRSRGMSCRDIRLIGLADYPICNPFPFTFLVVDLGGSVGSPKSPESRVRRW